MTLVPIPWQPTLFLAPSTLARLTDGSRRLGRNIYLNGPDAAWRSEARQEYLWDLNGHDPSKANDPTRGPRVHMRGAGLDGPTDKATRGALIAAGLLPDANELWHFSDPNWPLMPIIKTNTSTSGNGTAIPVTPAADIERSIAMGVLKLHKVINATQAKQPWLVSNEITLRYALLDQHGHDNLLAMGVEEGAPISTTTMDEIDSYRGALWPANLLAGFH